MWHSFKNFQNSRKIVVVRDKNGSRYQIRFDTGYSKIEKSTERLEGGGIDTGWQGGTQIEVSLRCLLAGVCSTLDRLEHTMGMAHGIRAPGESFLSSTFGNDTEKKARRRRRQKYPVPLMQRWAESRKK